MSRKAFTLIELLIVVLIIGILSAIAIPMYQGAVDKSHWSTMLPGAKAIKDAEEAIKMTNGAYTDNMANLDVTMNNADLTFALVTPNNTADPNVIRVTNSKLANVRLASYLDDNPKFAGQLHCEAKTGDERAERLCGKLLLGQYLKNTDDGYTRYLLDQPVDKATCGAATGSWSSSKTKCYNTTEERCGALGMPVISGEDKCGYRGNSGVTIKNEGVCEGTGADCRNLTIEKGGLCIATGGNASYGSCAASNNVAGTIICETDIYTYCGWGNTYDGGVCVGNSGGSCWAAPFKNGSICYGNHQQNDCPRGGYDETSCCCGAYCGNAPKCADRGITCDPQYLK